MKPHVLATAKKMDLKTTVFETEKRIMQRSASDEIANFIKNYHEKMGVEFKLGSRVQKISTENKTRIILDDGQVSDPDFVVIGVGVHAACDIAQEAGIDCNNGILVDETCLTSEENIYAAGDCVSCQ